MLPDWASVEVYEYDLGASTSCHQCGVALKEGSKVYEDLDDLGTLYCSEECCCKVEVGE